MKEVFSLIRSDLYRYTGSTSLTAFVRNYFLFPGFNYSVIYRLCVYLRKERHRAICYVPLRILLFRRSLRLGIEISPDADIGPGLYIGHYGGITVGNVAIGRNCNISQGVTIGMMNRGKREGLPEIGDNVYIAPGAKILGRIRIGNDVAVGANSVVTTDVPDHGVVVGIPARVVALTGSEGYVQNRVETMKQARVRASESARPSSDERGAVVPAADGAKEGGREATALGRVWAKQRTPPV